MHVIARAPALDQIRRERKGAPAKPMRGTLLLSVFDDLFYRVVNEGKLLLDRKLLQAVDVSCRYAPDDG